MRARHFAVAQAEIADAAEYYAAVSPGLGTAFKKEAGRELSVINIGQKRSKVKRTVNEQRISTSGSRTEPYAQ